MRGFERRLLARENACHVRKLAAAAPRAWAAISQFKPECVVGRRRLCERPRGGACGAAPHPRRSTGGRRPPGCHQPHAAALRAAHLPQFPIAGLEPPKFVLTGRPLSATAARGGSGPRLAEFGLIPVLPVVLVFGGSQGAQTLNRACLDAFADRDLELQVIHVCGERNHDAVPAELEQRGAPVERYKLARLH